jgi:hypothetical protein
MENKMKLWKVLLCGALLSSGASYAGVKEGRITSVLVLNSIPDRAFVKVEGAFSQAEPSCSVGSYEFDFIFDMSTPTGKALYALALATHASGAVVIAGGFGSCSLRSGYEDLDYIQAKT